jgi:hypothetical protein
VQRDREWISTITALNSASSIDRGDGGRCFQA